MSPFFLAYFPVSGVMTAALIFLLLRTGWALLIAADIPNHRSLHDQPIPRIGGVVALPLALLPTLLLLPDLRAMAGAGMALWALSFVDDRGNLPIGIRFTAHVGAALGVVLAWPAATSVPPPFLMLLLVVVIVWGTNLYNFMDGADGLAGGMAVIGFSAYALSASQSDMVILATLLVAVSMGFLFFNFPPAKVFLGDAGSVPLGFIAATLGVYGWQQLVWPMWFPLLVFSPFVVDATVTLLKRILTGKNFWLAHREHYYQRLVRMGWTHRRLALSEYVLMIIAGCSAMIMLRFDSCVQFFGLLIWVAIYAAAMATIDIRWKRHTQREIEE